MATKLKKNAKINQRIADLERRIQRQALKVVPITKKLAELQAEKENLLQMANT